MIPTPTDPRGLRAQGLQVCPDLIDVRTPAGELAYRATDHQAALLLAGNICEPIRSRSGALCYLRMHRTPPARGFITTAAQADFTVSREAVHATDRTGIVYRHNQNGRGKEDAAMR